MRSLTLTIAILLLAAASVRAESPLADAVEAANTARIDSLLADGVGVDVAQPDGMTALHWAVHLDNEPLVRRLIVAKANVNAATRYGVTPLSLGCTNGTARMVEALLAAGADPKVTLKGGETTLMTASRVGNGDVVKLLLDRGVDVNARERTGQTALMWAAAEGHADVVQLLIEAKADFTTRLKSGFTALHFAAREGKMAAAMVLVGAGGDVNDVITAEKTNGRSPRNGTSPLVLAVENGHFELAIALVKAGADPNDQRSGYTPLHVLTWVRKPPRGDGEDGEPPPEANDALTSLEFARALVHLGADVNCRLERGAGGKGKLNRKGATPFLLASMTADVPYMKRLVELGADPLIPNFEHCTPLHAAAGVGTIAPREEAGTEPEAMEAVKLAIALGGNVDAVDDNGETPMHGAAYKAFPLVVQLLSDKGAKIEVWNRKNRWGWTPLLIAQGYRTGNFRPMPEVIAAVSKLMREAGVEIPPPPGVKGDGDYNPPKPMPKKEEPAKSSG